MWWPHCRSEDEWDSDEEDGGPTGQAAARQLPRGNQGRAAAGHGRSRSSSAGRRPATMLGRRQPTMDAVSRSRGMGRREIGRQRAANRAAGAAQACRRDQPPGSSTVAAAGSPREGVPGRVRPSVQPQAAGGRRRGCPPGRRATRRLQQQVCGAAGSVHLGAACPWLNYTRFAFLPLSAVAGCVCVGACSVGGCSCPPRPLSSDACPLAPPRLCSGAGGTRTHPALLQPAASASGGT